MRAGRAAASLLIVALVGAIPLPAYAVDQVIETELMVSGTPEADGKPVKLDTTILTTDPPRLGRQSCWHMDLAAPRPTASRPPVPSRGMATQ
jgi:hypothetical protein